MPEPILTSGFLLAAGYSAAVSMSRPCSAVSPEAESVRQNTSAVIENAKRSEALFGRNSECISNLIALAEECIQTNWDGYGAQPVSAQSLNNAIALITSLPDNLPMPECSIEPDGEISLDWLPAPHRTLSISAGSSNRLPYAWSDGTDRGHAVAKLEDGRFPARILAEIKRFALHEPILRIA